jgi:hypothetical protein
MVAPPSTSTLTSAASPRAAEEIASDYKEVGIAKPLLPPPHYRGSPRIYRTDRDTLKFIAASQRVRLQLEGDQEARPFEIWKDGRRELGQLAATD